MIDLTQDTPLSSKGKTVKAATPLLAKSSTRPVIPPPAARKSALHDLDHLAQERRDKSYGKAALQAEVDEPVTATSPSPISAQALRSKQKPRVSFAPSPSDTLLSPALLDPRKGLVVRGRKGM